MAGHYNILIVDDEELNRILLSQMLEETGNYTVDKAENGKVAWTMVQDYNYDLIISDIKMPEMNGLELLELVKGYNQAIPVVVVTAFASIETAVEAIQKGASNFLKKPFTLEEISSVTTKALKAAAHRKIQSGKLENLSRSFSVTTKSKHSIIDPVFHQIRDIAKYFGFSDNQLHMNIYLSLSEAIANAVDHGNKGDENKNITIHSSVNNTGITISVVDEGDGFNPTLVSDPTDGSNILRSNGRGIFLMKCYMDSVTYEKNGSKVTMVIQPQKN